MFEILRSLLDHKALRNLGPAIVPSLAAALVYASWPGMDVQAAAHDALRLLGAPGHGVVNDVIGWLRSPARAFLAELLPVLIGSLFVMGGALQPLGNGNGSAVAWVLMVPATAIGGRSTVPPIVFSMLLTLAVLAACFASADRSQEERGWPHTFAIGDLSWMIGRSLFFVIFIPILPMVILLAHAQRSVTWPGSEALTARSATPPSGARRDRICAERNADLTEANGIT